jgi:hypothetical protein
MSISAALIIVPATYLGAPHPSAAWSIRGTRRRCHWRGSSALGCGASTVLRPESRACSRHVQEQGRERGVAGTMIKAYFRD